MPAARRAARSAARFALTVSPGGFGRNRPRLPRLVGTGGVGRVGYARAEVEAIGGCGRDGALEVVAASAGGGGGASGAGGNVSSGEGVGVSGTEPPSGGATSCDTIGAAADAPPSEGVEARSTCIGIATTGGGGSAAAATGATNSGLISRPAVVSIPSVKSPRGGGVGAATDGPLGPLPPSLSLMGTVVAIAFGASFWPPPSLLPPPFSRTWVAAFAAAPALVKVDAAGVPGNSSSGYGDGYWARISYPA